MTRGRRTKLEPWIEQVILSYGTEPKEEKKNTDESACCWGRQEDRKCFSSLINCTVCVYSFTLQFNMDSEQTKSQFYLSVGELTTTSAGVAKDNSPCCTSLISDNICTTWRYLLAQDSVHTQNTESEFSLSELLGEWQHDWCQSLLEDREDTFNVPVSHLHIPDDLSQKLHTPSQDNSETQSGLVPPSEDRLTDPPETDQPIVAADSRQTDRPVPLERRHPAHDPTLSYMQKNHSLPSWMFETQEISRIGEGSSCKQKAVAAIAPQRPSNVHSDGTSFSYSYQLCGRISKDLSHLKIPDGMLHWAVWYLVPSMQTEVVKDTQLRPQTHPS